MNEDVKVPARAGARLIQQARAIRFKTGNGSGKIGHSDSHVMESFAALLYELRDHRIRLGGLEQLDAGIAGRKHCDINLFLGHCLAQLNRKPELLFVEGERSVERADRDA